MSQLRLILPSKKYKDEIMGYKREFIENNENMAGSAGLREAESFEKWLSAMDDNSKEETIREGLVPATTFIAISSFEENLLGMIDIRHRLNEYLLNFGGHIGFSVRRSQRQRGYATQILVLALKECEKWELKGF